MFEQLLLSVCVHIVCVRFTLGHQEHRCRGPLYAEPESNRGNHSERGFWKRFSEPGGFR